MNWSNCTEKSKLEDYFSTNRAFSSFGMSGADYFFNLRNEEDYLLAYNSCSPLKAIVGKRAKAFNTGAIEVLNKNTGNFAKGSEAKELKTLLANPNVLQTGKQFMAQQNIYIDIFGYCPVLLVKPTGMEYVTSSIWNIPPWLFDIDYTKKWLMSTEVSDVYSKYFIWWDGEKVALNKDNLKMVFDDGIGTDNDSALTIPDSRLKSLEYPISNIVAAYMSRNTLITKRGAVGILSNDSADASGTIPLQQTEKDSLQKDFRKYGIVGQPYQIIVTNASLKWQQIGFPTKELLLFEEIEDSVNRICDSYDFPPELISRSKSATIFSSESKRELRKMLYTDAIIPESDSRMEQLSSILLGNDSSIEITRDYTGIDVMQTDLAAAATARKALNEALSVEYDNGLITKNDWLEELGRDRLTEPGFDEYKKVANKPSNKPLDQ